MTNMPGSRPDIILKAQFLRARILEEFDEESTREVIGAIDRTIDRLKNETVSIDDAVMVFSEITYQFMEQAYGEEEAAERIEAQVKEMQKRIM